MTSDTWGEALITTTQSSPVLFPVEKGLREIRTRNGKNAQSARATMEIPRPTTFTPLLLASHHS